MSLQEPKAPIVRIRKKKVKRKSKENDVVILPVRASQNPRYSSLTTPPNPQTKGRECCRHMFAGCLKIPVCKLICFKCILPKCYGGTGSDDEDGEMKDEGYHSQNRRSSEILPQAEGGAQGGSEPQALEMSEIKGETVTLIPPPRPAINDYRKQPNKGDTRGFNAPCSEEGEMTYIEVESIPLHNEHIPDRTDPRETTRYTRDTNYEVPLKSGFDQKLKVALESKVSKYEDDYNNGNNSDDSESKYYVNEDVLKPKNSPVQQSGRDGLSVQSLEDMHYINVNSVSPSASQTHSRSSSHVSTEGADNKPNEYVNLKPLEDNERPSDCTAEQSIMCETKPKDAISDKHVSESSLKCVIENEVDLKVNLDIKSTETSKTGKIFQPEVVLLPEKARRACEQTTSDSGVSDIKSLLEQTGVRKDTDSDSHSSNEDSAEETSGDQTKLI